MPLRSAPLRHDRVRRDSIDVCAAGAPVISLEPGDGRVRVGLVMPSIGRFTDVSAQPAAACEVLRDAGRRSVDPPATIEAAAHEALVAAASRCSSWSPPDGAGLLAGFGGAAFPLLGAAYDAGAAPVREVPRWATPVVAACSARAGASAAFGDRATRPVIRALVDALRPEPSCEVGFSSLALGLIGRDVLEPDCLARLLRAERMPHPTHDLPDPSTLELARGTVNDWGAVRALRVLLDAAAMTDGLRILFDTVRYSRQLRGHGPSTLPNRLADLHDVHRNRVASAPTAPRPPAPPPVPRRSATIEAPRRPQHRLFAPPSDVQPVATGTPLAAGPDVQAIDGRTVGDLTFVVPRTAGDLVRWGRILSNCVGDFGGAVAAGRSTIVGIERSNALVFAVEISADGAIHQFAGSANRAPDDAVRRATVRVLRAAGIVCPDHPRNAPWLTDCEP